ncbi:MAG: hypothetical protein AAGI68_07450 [Planctomycetota bacterium]
MSESVGDDVRRGATPWATGTGALAAAVSLVWCVRVVVWVVYELEWAAMRGVNLSVQVGLLALVQAALVAGVGLCWVWGEGRGERWRGLRVSTSAWGMAPGVAVPGVVLVGVVWQLIAARG